MDRSVLRSQKPIMVFLPAAVLCYLSRKEDEIIAAADTQPKSQRIGTTIIAIGVSTGVIGALVNDLGMHFNAILIWTLISNPALFVWAVGSDQGLWNSNLSYKLLAGLYLTYEILGLFAISYLK